MDVLNWNPEWETGVPLIDQQHRQLLGQFESLLVAIHENHAENEIPGLLEFLAQHVELHFATEEFHMQATAYPQLPEHKAIHDDLRSRVADLSHGFAQDPTNMTEDLIDFLTDLLIQHINEEDRRMARHLLKPEEGKLGVAP